MRGGVWARDYVVDVYIMYLGCFLKLIACKIESVEMCECGEVGEGGELVGVEKEAPETWAAKQWRKRGERVSRKIEVLQPLQATKQAVEKVDCGLAIGLHPTIPYTQILLVGFHSITVLTYPEGTMWISL